MSNRFLGRSRPIGEARLLWEIGAAGADIRDLRGQLGLDSGYVSRMLRSLERQGLVVTEINPADRRVRRARLTEMGLAERGELDRRSDDLALSFLEPLSEGQRAKLVAAMVEVERLLSASMVSINIEDPTTPDAQWCIAQYFAELNTRFEAGFDPSISISADAHELTPPAGALLIARLRQQPVGCGALKFHADAPAELKRMWVAPAVRGLGVGRRLLHELEQQAKAMGAHVIRLETNRALSEAISLYRLNGYREAEAFNHEPYAHYWFEKQLS